MYIKLHFKVPNQIVHKSTTILYKTLYNTKNSCMLKRIIKSNNNNKNKILHFEKYFIIH